MKKAFIFILFIFLGWNLHSQSLGEERLSNARNSVVSILIEGIPKGTGFNISKDGKFITCYHVVASAFMPDTINNTIESKKIEAEFLIGKKIELELDRNILGNRYAVGYDYCVLKPKKPTYEPLSFLNLGTFDDIKEGDEIFTIGYPLGIKQQFVSKGIISTKWTDTAHFITNNNPDSLSREVAWLDLTTNKGNSGGPIIIIGKTPSEDQVVGIATFILNPFADNSEEIINRNESSRYFYRRN